MPHILYCKTGTGEEMLRGETLRDALPAATESAAKAYLRNLETHEFIDPSSDLIKEMKMKFKESRVATEGKKKGKKVKVYTATRPSGEAQYHLGLKPMGGMWQYDEDSSQLANLKTFGDYLNIPGFPRMHLGAQNVDGSMRANHLLIQPEIPVYRHAKHGIVRAGEYITQQGAKVAHSAKSIVQKAMWYADVKFRHFLEQDDLSKSKLFPYMQDVLDFVHGHAEKKDEKGNVTQWRGFGPGGKPLALHRVLGQWAQTVFGKDIEDGQEVSRFFVNPEHPEIETGSLNRKIASLRSSLGKGNDADVRAQMAELGKEIDQRRSALENYRALADQGATAQFSLDPTLEGHHTRSRGGYDGIVDVQHIRDAFYSDDSLLSKVTREKIVPGYKLDDVGKRTTDIGALSIFIPQVAQLGRGLTDQIINKLNSYKKNVKENDTHESVPTSTANEPEEVTVAPRLDTRPVSRSADPSASMDISAFLPNKPPEQN